MAHSKIAGELNALLASSSGGIRRLPAYKRQDDSEEKEHFPVGKDGKSSREMNKKSDGTSGKDDSSINDPAVPADERERRKEGDFSCAESGKDDSMKNVYVDDPTKAKSVCDSETAGKQSPSASAAAVECGRDGDEKSPAGGGAGKTAAESSDKSYAGNLKDTSLEESVAELSSGSEGKGASGKEDSSLVKGGEGGGKSFGITSSVSKQTQKVLSSEAISAIKKKTITTSKTHAETEKSASNISSRENYEQTGSEKVSSTGNVEQNDGNKEANLTRAKDSPGPDSSAKLSQSEMRLLKNKPSFGPEIKGIMGNRSDKTSLVTSESFESSERNQESTSISRLRQHEQKILSSKQSESRSSDINSNVAKKSGPPVPVKMGFSSDIQKELNAKFAASGLARPGLKGPPPGGKALFALKREQHARGALPDPPEQDVKAKQPKYDTPPGKDCDSDTGHIYEDLDFYQDPNYQYQDPCQHMYHDPCPESTSSNSDTDIKEKGMVDAGEKETARDKGNASKKKKKKKSKAKAGLGMLCMCRQTSADLPSATRTDSKLCLLTEDNNTLPKDSSSPNTGERKKKVPPKPSPKPVMKSRSGEGYEQLRKQPTYRGGYEQLQESEAGELPSNGNKVLVTSDGKGIKKERRSNKSSKNESSSQSETVEGDTKTNTRQSEKHISKESSYESAAKLDDGRKKMARNVRFEQKSEKRFQEKSSTTRTVDSDEDLGDMNSKKMDLKYSKMMKVSHRHEHSEHHSESNEEWQESTMESQFMQHMDDLEFEDFWSSPFSSHADDRFRHFGGLPFNRDRMAILGNCHVHIK